MSSLPCSRLLLTLVLAMFAAECAAAAEADPGGLMEVDMRGVVSHNDVIYLAPARQGWEGLPLGNGTFGAQVWQPDGLIFQLNTPLSGVYGGAIARLQLGTTPGMLAGIRSYRQRLSLYDATLHAEITTRSGKINATCLIPADDDGLVIQYTDSRSEAIESLVELETWRSSATRAAQGDSILVADVLKVQGEPDYRFAVAVGVDGATAAAPQADEKTLCLRTPSKQFTVWLAFAATRDPKVDPRALARQKLAALRTRGLDAVRSAHAQWWAKFWEKSFIKLASDDAAADYVANLWYIHLYAMGAGSRGEVPPKFNGGLWTEDYDSREWGSAYWHWNQQEVHWPLFVANHLELQQPYYDMYWNMLPAVKKWTKAFWEIDGAQYQETIPFNGAMGIFEKARGIHPRLPVPKNVAHTNLILSSSAEIAMLFWWHYLYTGDEKFLRERTYPVMKEVATFYVGYLEKDAQGRYNVYPANAQESSWSVKNPTPDLAAIRYLFPVLIETSKRLGLDAELRPVWQDRLDRLAPYAIDSATGAILPYEPGPGPSGVAPCQNPEQFAVCSFPLITIGSPQRELGVKTFHARKNKNVYGWNTDSIIAARLGLQGLEHALPAHAESYQDHPSGLQDYYNRKPAIHPYLEGSGTFATAVGEMLLQSFSGVIHLCPALPKAWSGDFKLLAMGGFEVTGHAQRGKVQFVTLTSQRGEQASVVNPFDAEAVVICGREEILKTSEKTLRFPTKAGQTYRIVPAGPPVQPVKVTAKPNDAPKHLSPSSGRWIGKVEMASAVGKLIQEPNPPSPPPAVSQITRPANPEVRPVRLPTPPKIDGDLSDEAWKNVKSLGPFYRLGQNAPAAEQTDVLVGCDDQSLYLGIVCWESRMKELVVECAAGSGSRDADVFLDDCVEIFLQPKAGSPEALWHLAVNVLGAWYDALGANAKTEDRKFNPQWQVAVSQRANRWIVEAAIPFESLAPYAPQRDEVWGLNVCRSEKASGETSTWAPLSQPRRHRPQEFGRLVFAGGKGAAPEQEEAPDLVAHWTGDDVKGLWVRDSSGHRHYGMVLSPMKQVDGKVGKALEFTGASFVSVPDAPDLNPTSAMTVALWVLPRGKGSMRLVDKGPAGGSDGYLIDTHPDNNIRVITRSASATIKETLPLDQWTHVAVTFGSGVLRVYLNGRVVSETANLRGPLSATQLPVRLGADSEGASRFAGLMDDVRIYRKSLTQEEIAALLKVQK